MYLHLIIVNDTTVLLLQGWWFSPAPITRTGMGVLDPYSMKQLTRHSKHLPLIWRKGEKNQRNCVLYLKVKVCRKW